MAHRSDCILWVIVILVMIPLGIMYTTLFLVVGTPLYFAGFCGNPVDWIKNSCNAIFEGS